MGESEPTPQHTGEALFQSLHRPVSPQSAEARVRQYIVRHRMRPGDRLPSQAELATELGCSQVVVREALRSLEALGLVEARVGSGWYVRAFDIRTASRIFAHSLTFHPAAVLDLLTVWRSTEGDLIRSLAGRLDERDLAILAELADRMCWRVSRGEAFAAEDGEFHRRLIAASGNLVALALVDLYWGVKEAIYEHGFPTLGKEDAPAIAASHVQIVDALRRGAGDEAGQLIRAHHNESERRFTAWLEEQQTDSATDEAEMFEAVVQAALLLPGTGRGTD